MKKIVITILLLAIIFTACKSDKEKVNTVAKAIPVKTAKVETKEISIPIHSSGKITSQKEVKLSFKTGGIVKHLFVEEGEAVKRGQVLAKLDLGEIQAKVNQAKAGYNKAKRDFQRVEALYKDSVVTLEQFQNVTTAMDVAKSNVEIAEFNLKHSQIIAPNNGKILKRFAEENELVGPGTPIIILGTSDNNWIMRVGLTDKDISKIKMSDKAKIKIDAFQNKIFDAKVTEIASAANPYTGTFEIELTITKTNSKLISGMIADVEIFPMRNGMKKIIPVSALIEANGSEGSVFIPIENNSKTKKVNIKISGMINNSVVVQNGLENVDEVITDGVEYLTDGEKIKILENGKGRQEAGNRRQETGSRKQEIGGEND